MMKTLSECKEYFKDVYMDYIAYGNHGDQQRRDRYDMMNEVLSFIFPEFEDVKPNWIKEALNEFPW